VAAGRVRRSIFLDVGASRVLAIHPVPGVPEEGLSWCRLSSIFEHQIRRVVWPVGRVSGCAVGHHCWKGHFAVTEASEEHFPSFFRVISVASWT